MRLGQFLERWARSFSGQRFRFRGATEFFDRANLTFRLRSADERAQVHEGRVKTASIAFRNEGGGELPDSVASPAGIDGLCVIENARKQTRDIRFDNRHRLIERESCDGVSGVTADTGKFAKGGRIARQNSTMSILYDLRDGEEIACAAVVTESLPGVQDVVLRRAGQGGEIGEPTEPLIIIRDNGSDLRLLEHELGDEDGVRIVPASPGKGAAVRSIP